MNPFDYINAINDGRNIMRGTENDDLAEKGYKPAKDYETELLHTKKRPIMAAF